MPLNGVHPPIRLAAITLVIAGTASCAVPAPDPNGVPSGRDSRGPSAPAQNPSPSLLAESDLADLGWYEATRVVGPGGTETRTLLIGDLGGAVRREIILGEQDPNGAAADAFAWQAPQAGGIFGESVLIWERRGGEASIEAVNVRTGSITGLVSVGDAVHVATADSGLAQVFFVSADSDSGRPTGLWVADLQAGGQPRRIEYGFAQAELTDSFKYRLVASSDGSLLAIQPEDGRVTILDPVTGRQTSVEPGGPIIAFAGNDLVAYGPRSSDRRPSVLLLDRRSAELRTVVSEVDSAQLVPGTDGPLLAYMQIDPLDARVYQIGAVELSTGDTWIAYTSDPETVGPLLARRDRKALGVQTPQDTVLLVDSFVPFSESAYGEPDLHDQSALPLLLNMRTLEFERIGPFRQPP